MKKTIIAFLSGFAVALLLTMGYNFYNRVLLKNQVYTNCGVIGFSIRHWLKDNQLIREENGVFVVSDRQGDYPSYAQYHHFARTDEQGNPVDEWGNKYRYRGMVKDKLLYISVCSSGSDGKFDTGDDVCFAHCYITGAENANYIKSFSELEQFLFMEGVQDISKIIK